MAIKSQALIPLISFLLILSSTTNAHNITRFLSQYPEFSSFNSLLTQTNVSLEINSRQPVTVLVVENSAISSLTSLPQDTLKNVLSLHSMLDYFDNEKIHNVGKNSIIATLFQTSGLAQNMQGFLNVTRLSDNRVYFGSADKGAPLVATLVKAVGARPFNLSVLQVTGAIMPPGLPGAPSPVPVSIPAKPLEPVAEPAAPPAEESAPADEAPTAAPEASADSPADAPVADSPVADAPAALSPVADAPSDDDVSDKGAGGRVGAGVSWFVGIVMGVGMLVI